MKLQREVLYSLHWINFDGSCDIFLLPILLKIPIAYFWLYVVVAKAILMKVFGCWEKFSPRKSLGAIATTVY